jgi:hypothetical protein
VICSPYLRYCRSLAVCALATFLCLALTACRDDIKVYRVAKETNAPVADPHAGHNHPPGQHDAPSPARPKLSWTLPGGWEESAPGEMRLASFRVQGNGGKMADFGIFPLPGQAGGDVNNVNRWRGQVGLKPLQESEVATNAQAISIAGGEGQLYEMAGENTSSGDPTRILGAIQHRGGVAWFFKMTGDDQLVAANKAAFVEFLRTLQFSAPSTELPPGHPPMDGMAGSAPASAPAAGESASEHPEWTVPAGWQAAPAGQFLIAKFNLTEGAASASVNVSMSPGDGGGLMGNVNRWRKQMGLPELTEAELMKTVSTRQINGIQVTLVELSGKDARTGEAAQVVGAIVPQGGRTWFYKLSGADSIVAREKQPFQDFLGSVKY